MFDEKELEVKIIAYLEKKKYATILMIARAVRSDFNTTDRLLRSRLHQFKPIACIWSKKLNMKLHYYSSDADWVKIGGRIERAHKALQKRWLKMALKLQLSSRSWAYGQRTVKIIEAMDKPALTPCYFLLSKEDVLKIYKEAANALPKP